MELETARAVIDQLSSREVRRITGISSANLWHWRRSNQIPSRYYVVLSTELEKFGLKASPIIFGMSQEPAE